jgi:hypothetical protein
VDGRAGCFAIKYMSENVKVVIITTEEGRAENDI